MKTTPDEDQPEPSRNPEATAKARAFGVKLMLSGAFCITLPFLGLKLRGMPDDAIYAGPIMGLVLILIGALSFFSARSRFNSDFSISGKRVAMWGGLGCLSIVGVFTLGIIVLFGYAYLQFKDKLTPRPRPRPAPGIQRDRQVHPPGANPAPTAIPGSDTSPITATPESGTLPASTTPEPVNEE